MNQRKPSASSWCRARPPQGFSLVELLVVIAIIGILSSLAIAGLGNVARSTNLATGAQNVADQIALARQMAASRNLPVEIRIYQLPEFGSKSGESIHWRGIQALIIEENVSTPIARAVMLPERVVVNSSSMASPLLAAMAQGSEPFSGFGDEDRPFRSMTMRPNGQVDLGPSTHLVDNAWFLSLDHDGAPVVADGLPKNFVTIQVQPITGRVTVLRP